MSMNTHFAGQNVSTHTLRAELISRSEAGDKNATELLLSLAGTRFSTAGELVLNLRTRSGPTWIETTLAGVGLVSFGLVFGILALTFNGIVTADMETLLVLLSAFAIGQFGLINYSKCSHTKYGTNRAVQGSSLESGHRISSDLELQRPIFDPK